MDTLTWVAGGVLIPACLILGARRVVFRNLHANIALFAIPPLVRVMLQVQVHDDVLRRWLSFAVFVVAYVALSYLGAWMFERAAARAQRDE